MTREELLRRLAGELFARRRRHPLRVAIDGVDAAGKTTLADELASHLEARGRTVIRASVDGFHRPRAERLRRGDLSPQGYYQDSFDYVALRCCLLEPLGPGGDLRHRRAMFDFRCDRALEPVWELAPADAILLFDGVFLLRSELRGCWDFAVFVHASFERTLERALVRDRELFGDPERVRRRYLQRYIPGQRIYLAEQAPAEHAQLVVDNDDPRRPGLRLGAGYTAAANSTRERER